MAEKSRVSRVLMVCLVLGIVAIRSTSQITVGGAVDFGECYYNCVKEFPAVGIFICSRLCDRLFSTMETVKEIQSSRSKLTTKQHPGPAAKEVESSINGK